MGLSLALLSLGFGFSYGLNPPVDIHIPTSEDIYLEVQREKEDNKTLTERDYEYDEKGEKDEAATRN